jgi:hypothetical protein
MEIKEIQLVTDIENIYDDGVDVIVTLDDDFSYVIEVVTPQHFLSLMKERNQPFIEPGENYIIVEKLTPEIIEKAIKAFVEENRAYWLKLYHFAGKIDTAVFNKLQDEQTEYLKELDELDNS